MAEKEIAATSEKTKPAPAQPAEESVFAPLMELRHRMDDLFEDVIHGWRMPSFKHDFGRLDPFAVPRSVSKLRADLVDVKFDVSDSDDAIEIAAELPGMDGKDIELELSGGMLTIKGEKKTEKEEKKKDYYCSERRFGYFRRSFRMPDAIDEEKIKATFDKGVLDVSLPKRPEAKAKVKKISISNKK